MVFHESIKIAYINIEIYNERGSLNKGNMNSAKSVRINKELLANRVNSIGLNRATFKM